MYKQYLKDIIDHFGNHRQLLKFGEEYGELIRAINRYEGGYCDDKSEIEEELADVEVMLRQIRLMYDLSNKNIKKEMKRKINRTYSRYIENQ